MAYSSNRILSRHKLEKFEISVLWGFSRLQKENISSTNNSSFLVVWIKNFRIYEVDEEKWEDLAQFIMPQLVIITFEYGRLKPLSATTALLSPINFATLHNTTFLVSVDFYYLIIT